MATWIHLWTDADDMTDVDDANMFEGAWRERFGGLAAPGSHPDFAAGDRRPLYLGRVQFLAMAGEQFLGWLKVVPTPGDAYDPSADIFVPSATYWTFAPTVAPGITTASLMDDFLGGVGYTIEYPREHADAAATQYVSARGTFGPFADGDRSRDRSSGIVMLRAAGAWTPTADVVPDRLTAYKYDEVGSGSPLFGAGDYLIPANYNQVRDVYDALVDFQSSGVGVALDAQFGQGTAPTWAAAKAAAEAAFAASAGSGPAAGQTGAYSASNGSFAGGTYTATIAAGRVTVTAGFSPINNASVQFWGAAEKFPGGTLFDDQGLGLTDGTWANYGTVATSGAPGAHVAGTLAVPTWCADPTAGPTDRGYFLRACDGTGGNRVFQVTRNKVAGGFAFTS